MMQLLIVNCRSTCRAACNRHYLPRNRAAPILASAGAGGKFPYNTS
jgi:hypothetical protein